MLDAQLLRRYHVVIRLLSALLGGAAAVVLGAGAQAAGTDAGREIQNSAQAAFSIGGVAQTPVASNSVQTFVDELLDVVVVSVDGGPVGVSSPGANAITTFTVTNTGNGSEAFVLAAANVTGTDDFDVTFNQLYLESNAVPGLQIGGGGDTAYVPNSNDPLLLEDEMLTVYVESTIPGSLAQNAEAAVQLRAVATTIVAAAGTDDPAAAGFPAPGASFPGVGDPDELGGGNVTAVVGATHDPTNLLIRAEGGYRVSAAVVAISKAAASVLDPFGGATLVPGSVISYQIDVTVSGSGSAQSLVITDLIPPELEYQAGTLVVSALPAGEEVDDDFAPVGTDNTGFEAGTQTITVNLGDVAGGSPALVITFDTAIR